MFLIDYYCGLSPMTMFERVMAGPIILFLGIRTYVRSESEMFKFLNLLVACIGALYILKPLIWLLTNWSMYAEEDVDLKIEGNKILLWKRDEQICLPVKDFKVIRKQSSFYSLSTSDGVKLYLPKDQLSVEEITYLERL